MIHSIFQISTNLKSSSIPIPSHYLCVKQHHPLTVCLRNSCWRLWQCGNRKSSFTVNTPLLGSCFIRQNSGYLNKCWIYLVGGFNPSEKYESHLGWLFPIYGKIKNVPNHQPVMIFPVGFQSLIFLRRVRSWGWPCRAERHPSILRHLHCPSYLP